MSAATIRENLITQFRLMHTAGRIYRSPVACEVAHDDEYSHNKAFAESIGNAIAPAIQESTVLNVKQRFDPTSDLPSGPSAGDVYLSTATANGWTIGNLYTWNGSAYDEVAAETGLQIVIKDTHTPSIYIVDGWVDLGAASATGVSSVDGRTGTVTLSDLYDTVGAASTVQGNLNTHAGLTTTAHGLGASAFHADSFFALSGHDHGGSVGMVLYKNAAGTMADTVLQRSDATSLTITSDNALKFGEAGHFIKNNNDSLTLARSSLTISSGLGFSQIYAGGGCSDNAFCMIAGDLHQINGDIGNYGTYGISVPNLRVTSVSAGMTKLDTSGLLVAAVKGTDFIAVTGSKTAKCLTKFTGTTPDLTASVIYEDLNRIAIGSTNITTVNSGKLLVDGTSSLLGVIIVGGQYDGGLVIKSGSNFNNAQIATYDYNNVLTFRADNTGLYSATLTSGMIKSVTGVMSIATSGTDFIAGGVGTAGKIPKWSSTGVLTDSSWLSENATGVGIGTTSPLTKLHASGTQTSPSLTEKGIFSIQGVGNDIGFFAGITTGGDSWLQALRTDNNTAKNILLNPSGGNIGIRTTSPTSKLDIQGNNFDALRFSDVDDNEAFGFFYQANSGSGKLYLCGKTGYNSVFTSADAKVTFQQNGNVGIGTGSPVAQLHVVGTANAWTSRMSGSTTTGQSYGLTITAGTNATDVAFGIRNAADSANYFVVRGDGHVDIIKSFGCSDRQVATVTDGFTISPSKTRLELESAGIVSGSLGTSGVVEGQFVYVTRTNASSYVTINGVDISTKGVLFCYTHDKGWQ